MKIGFISMPLQSHLFPMTALARELQSRGNEIIFFCLPDAEQIVCTAGLAFVAFGEEEYPTASTSAAYAQLSRLGGEEATRYTLEHIHPGRCQIALEQLPEKLLRSGIEAVVIDAAHHFVQIAPLSMGIPYIQVWNTLPFDGSGATPPFAFGWPHETSKDAIARNRRGVTKMELAFAPVRKVAESWIRRRNLPINLEYPGLVMSPLAHISQTPKEFDFEGIAWPETFHYAGPLQDGEGRQPVFFPWDKLTGAPLVFASMGTLLNGHEQAFNAMLYVAEQIPHIQLVIAIGNTVRYDKLAHIPSNAIIVDFAPQLHLLKQAALCITHAGLNTVLECLMFGVPMVAIPVGFDQPGVAERVRYHGVGEKVPLELLSKQSLLDAVQTVLAGENYRIAAKRFKEVLGRRRGVDLAADIIEQALKFDLLKTEIQAKRCSDRASSGTTTP